MSITKEELDLYNEWERVRSAFVRAKETLPRDSDEYKAAKAEMSELRTYWRQIGEAVSTRVPVPPITSTTGVN